MLKKLAGLPNSWMRMQNSDSRWGDMRNCGSVIADCRSQAGHIPHICNLLSVLQDIWKIFAFCNMFSSTPRPWCTISDCFYWQSRGSWQSWVTYTDCMHRLLSYDFDFSATFSYLLLLCHNDITFLSFLYIVFMFVLSVIDSGNWEIL